jgi:DNA-binding transcriptional regulator/RsmH inhibitor MraZ
MSFFGTTRHRFDEKWRIVLPLHHREMIVPKDSPVYIAPGDQGQVVMFPPASFQERLAEKTARQRDGADGMREYLAFTKRTNVTKVDSQGRLVLPEPFRDRMAPEVLLIGAGDRLELWSEAAHDAFFLEHA